MKTKKKTLCILHQRKWELNWIKRHLLEIESLKKKKSIRNFTQQIDVLSSWGRADLFSERQMDGENRIILNVGGIRWAILSCHRSHFWVTTLVLYARRWTHRSQFDSSLLARRWAVKSKLVSINFSSEKKGENSTERREAIKESFAFSIKF